MISLSLEQTGNSLSLSDPLLGISPSAEAVHLPFGTLGSAPMRRPPLQNSATSPMPITDISSLRSKALSAFCKDWLAGAPRLYPLSI